MKHEELYINKKFEMEDLFIRIIGLSEVKKKLINQPYDEGIFRSAFVCSFWSVSCWNFFRSFLLDIFIPNFPALLDDFLTGRILVFVLESILDDELLELLHLSLHPPLLNQSFAAAAHALLRRCAIAHSHLFLILYNSIKV